MSLYQAESFYRAKIKDSITDSQSVPITIRLSKLPTRTTGLLTISPNTEYEEIVEFDNLDAVAMTADITKRGISPVSIALTIDGTDYNNTVYQFAHTTNDIIRGDVNHLHINQGIGNSTLATNLGVGIVRLATAAVDANDPIVVGDNDVRLDEASTTNIGITKLSVAPASAVNPIACGDNDPRLSTTVVSANGMAGTVNASNDITLSTTITGVLKGNGTTISAASAGTDYYAPGSTDVAVADGGTGRSTATAYAPIFGGTTSTGAHQSGTVGTTGQVLTSNGAGALPTFKTGIVRNGTLVPFSSTYSSPGAGSQNGTSTGIITNPSVAYVTYASGTNGTLTIQKSTDDSIFSTLYALTGGTSGVFVFVIEGGYSYRVSHVHSVTNTSTVTITYTV